MLRQSVRAIETDDQRAARYATARAFVEGDQWATRQRRGESRLTLNYAQALVVKTASYALAEPVTFNVLALNGAMPGSAEQAEELLNATLEAINAHASDLAAMIEASVIGDAACKVTWDFSRDMPQVTAVDPAGLVATVDPTRPHEALRIRHTYTMSADAIMLAIPNPPEALDPRRSYTVAEHWTQDLFEIWIDNTPHSSNPNPYGWVPYALLHNNRNPHEHWGRSDLDNLYDVCREINSRVSTLAQILELSGAPIVVLENVEGSEGITIHPGAKWELPEDSKAYLLDLLQGGGIRLHIDGIDVLYRALHDLAETPRTAFGDTGRPLSGAALEVEIQPLVQRVRRKRNDMAAYYTTRNAMLLDLLDKYGSGAASGHRITRPIWPGILPSDSEATAREAVQLTAAAIISRATAAERVGIADPGAEANQIRAEQQRSTEREPQNG